MCLGFEIEKYITFLFCRVCELKNKARVYCNSNLSLETKFKGIKKRNVLKKRL